MRELSGGSRAGKQAARPDLARSLPSLTRPIVFDFSIMRHCIYLPAHPRNLWPGRLPSHAANDP